MYTQFHQPTKGVDDCRHESMGGGGGGEGEGRGGGLEEGDQGGSLTHSLHDDV